MDTPVPHDTSAENNIDNSRYFQSGLFVGKARAQGAFKKMESNSLYSTTDKTRTPETYEKSFEMPRQGQLDNRTTIKIKAQRFQQQEKVL